MAVISGILKDPIGGPRVGVVIELRAVRTSATVVNQARSQSITDATGKYTLTVEPGAYDVMITAGGRQPERVGGITVALNSQNGTLNDFLTIPGEADLTPEIVATVDRMRAEAANSAAAAKTSETNIAASATAIANALSRTVTTDQTVAGAVNFTKSLSVNSVAVATKATSLGTLDLNTVRAEGAYYQGSNANATVALNYPANSAGSLIVIDSHVGSAGNTCVTQQYYLYRFPELYYQRSFDGTAWTAWDNFDSRRNSDARYLQIGAYGFGGFGAIKNFTTDTEMKDFIRNAATGSQILRNNEDISLTPRYAAAMLLKVADTWSLWSAGPQNRGVRVAVGNTAGGQDGVYELWTDKNLPNPLKLGDYGLGGGALHQANALQIAYKMYRLTAASTNVPTATSYGAISLPIDGNVIPTVAYLFVDQTGRLRTGLSNGSTGTGLISYGVWGDYNTTVDANGFIKKASPIVKLFGDGSSELNDQSQGVTTERISEGVYRVSGVLGFNGDGAWGGAGNGIEIPVDDNKRPVIWIESKILPDGDIEIRTYHRTYDTGPYSTRNIEVMETDAIDSKGKVIKGQKIYVPMPDGEPVDIPAGRWIDLRVEMPVSDEPGPIVEPEPIPDPEVVPDTELQPEVETDQPATPEPEIGTEPEQGDTPEVETKE